MLCGGVLSRLLVANFDMLCSSFDVLYDDMGLDCIRMCLDFYLDFIKWEWKSGIEVVC